MRPFQRYHFSELPSTNDKAKELSRRYAVNEFLAVTTDLQTSGRGRNGKVWLGRANENVYCSLAVRHGAMSGLAKNGDSPMTNLAAYQALGSLAALQAIRSFLPPMQRHTAQLKYPNDVYLLTAAHESKKVCGVLVEHEFVGAECIGSIIGIGINVRQTDFPAELAVKASSLLACGIDVEVEDVMAALLRESEKYCELYALSGRKDRAQEAFSEWWRELALEGVRVAVSGTEGVWIALRLQEDGSLLVRRTESDETRVVMNGDSLVRLDW